MRATRLPITGPCPVDLERQGPAGVVRFCEHCDKDVHVLSAMTRAEAGVFLRAHAGHKLCLSYRVDEKGEILFRDDCAPSPGARGGNLVPLAALSRRSTLTTGSFPATTSFLPRAAAALALGTVVAACTPHGEGEGEAVEVLDVVEPQVPVLVGGATVIPERPEPPQPGPAYEIDGEMEIPPVEALGDVAIPNEPLGQAEEPCAKPEPTPKPTPTYTAKRGKIALPVD